MCLLFWPSVTISRYESNLSADQRLLDNYSEFWDNQWHVTRFLYKIQYTTHTHTQNKNTWLL